MQWNAATVMRPSLFFFRCVEAILRAMHLVIRSPVLCKIGIVMLHSAVLCNSDAAQ
jgi:hypothetical protein